MNEQLKRGFIIQIVQLLSNNNQNLLDDYVRCGIEMNLVSHVLLSDERVSSRDIAPSLLHYSKALTIICNVLINWLYTQIMLNNTC